MSSVNNTFFISDLHLGHKNILNFSPQRGGTTIAEHDEWIISQWNSVVNKGDTVWVLGDVAFTDDALKLIPKLNGQKMLVRGNHDTQNAKVYLQYFQNIYGLIKRHGVWLSHSPIHPAELRGRFNVHGHVHHNTIPDPRYINVCVEALNGVPMSLEQLKTRLVDTYV